VDSKEGVVNEQPTVENLLQWVQEGRPIYVKEGTLFLEDGEFFIQNGERRGRISREEALDYLSGLIASWARE